jgi:DNA polymerase III subunit beta
MKFTVNSSDLQRVLTKIGGVIPSKSTMPMLENMLFDLVNNKLTITATDLEISLTAWVEVKSSEDGRVTVPAKRLIDTVRSLGEVPITFSTDSTTHKVSITTGNGQYGLTGESAKEFPPTPDLQASTELTMESNILRRIIHQTAFAVSTDELRPAMMGVLLQSKGSELRAVSTDGHRLVKLTLKAPQGTALKRDIIIPAKAFNLVGRSLEAGKTTISIGDTHVKFSFDATILISRLIDETYPNYESVIPRDNDKTMTVKRDAILSSLRRVSLYASATTHQVRFAADSGALTIMAQDLDFGGEAKETIECEYAGDRLEIGFNSSYILDILSHLESEQASFKFSTPTRAGLIAPATPQQGEDVLMLVMPVRLNA